MKQFINTNNLSYTFSSCEGCDKNCCNGKNGTIFSQIILDDFKEIYEYFPILFIYGDLGYLKPVYIITNGKDFCLYNKDSKCTIYDKRASICKTYPLSANIDNNTYIDILCPAVNSKEKSEFIIKRGEISKAFDSPTLYNYQEKYIKTHFEFEPFNKKEDFSLALTINGMQFYKYNKESQNEYMKMHQKSLIHLENEYFKNLK